MSLPIPNPAIATDNVSDLWDEPNDEQGLTPAQLKAKFDKFAVDWMAFYLGTLAPAGCSLADLADAVMGAIPDGSLTAAKIQADTLTEAIMAAAMKKQTGGVAKYDDLACGWMAITGACVRVSDTQITIAGNWRNALGQGNRFKCTQSRAYTNDPAAGSNIELNMADTSGFNVGNTVTVSSGAGSETAKITAVHANTHITVDALALNHTTVTPLVTCEKYLFLKADPTYRDETELTTVDVYGGSDFTLGAGDITLPLYSKMENPQGWPGEFNWAPVFSGGAMTVSSVSIQHAKIIPEGKNTLKYMFYATMTFGGTASIGVEFTAPLPNKYKIDGTYGQFITGKAADAPGSASTQYLLRWYDQSTMQIIRPTNFSLITYRLAGQGFYEY